jgi:hypothetical protein
MSYFPLITFIYINEDRTYYNGLVKYNFNFKAGIISARNVTGLLCCHYLIILAFEKNVSTFQLNS